MARLEALIKVRKWDLDEKRRLLVALEKERADILSKIEQVEQEMSEQRDAGSLEVGPVSLGAYMDGAKKRIDAYSAELRVKDEEIAEQHAEVSEAYKELKTFEIAEAQEKERKRKELDRKEQIALDEQGLQGFWRDKE